MQVQKEMRRRKTIKMMKAVLAVLLALTAIPGWTSTTKAADGANMTIGENIVLNKETIASSTANGLGPELVVDGNTAAPQWNSSDMKNWGAASDTSKDEVEQTPQWIVIDRGEDAEPANITQIKLWYNARVWPMEYQIYTASASDLETGDTVDLSRWDEVVSVDRPSSASGTSGQVVNGAGQNIADTNENSDTITAETVPALDADVQLQRYVLIYFAKVNAQAPGNNINLREIQIFDDTQIVDVQAALDSISASDLIIAEDQVTLDPAAQMQGVEFYVRGSDLERVVDNEGRLSGANIGDREVTLLVGVRETRDPDNKAEKNLKVIIPDQSDAYPQSYFPAVDTQNEKPEVIPTIQEWYGYQGEFKLDAQSRIIYHDEADVGLERAAENMKADLLEITGLDLPIIAADASAAGASDIYLASVSEDSYDVGDEGYLMITDDNGLRIYSPTYIGCLYGTISVEQILYQAEDHLRVPKGIARDYPAYEVRGIMLDVARTPYRLQQLQDYTKVMLWYKMNEYHLHINDNDNCNITGSVEDHSGFHRLESDVFPSLESEVKHAGIPEELVNADYYLHNEDYQGNPTYTKEEWRTLKETCTDLGINMITEIDLPGHSLLYNKYAEENPDNIPQLEGGVKYTTNALSTNGGAELLDLTGENAERALWFAQTLWNEYTDPDQEGGPVIYGDVVHIGADEYWDHSTAGIRDKFALFADSLRQVIQGNLGSDTKIRMWGAGSVMFSTAGSVLEDVDLASNYQLDVWYHGYEDAKARIAEGFEVINCRDAYLYGNPGRSNRDVPNAEYLFNEWNPAMFTDNTPQPGTGSNPLLGEPNLLGAKTVIWGDQSQEGMTERDVNQRVLRAVSIVSEKTWGATDEEDTFEQFERRAARLAEGPGTQIAMQVDSASSLVLDYDFDHLSADGMTVYDTSGNGYDGTLSEAGTVSEDGYLRFEGGKLSTPLKTLSYPYTVAFNVRVNAEQAAKNTTASSIFSGYDGQLQIAGTDDGSLSANVNYFTRDLDYQIPTDGTEISVMLVGTFQGTKLYINGELQTFLSQKSDQDGVAPGNVSTMYSSFPLPLEKIGEGLYAELADLEVYDRAFSSEEASSYYTEEWQEPVNKTNVAQGMYAGGTSRTIGDGTGYDNSDGRVRVAFKAVDGDAFELANDPADQMDVSTSDIYSYWKGNSADSALSVDLGEVREISEIQIQWRYGGKGRDFDIQVSDDGINWESVSSIRNNQDFLSVIALDAPIDTRYIRMQGIASNSVPGYMIQEFLVYETADKTSLGQLLDEAEKIVNDKGLGFETQNETDRELFAAVVQARAVRYHAQMSVSDVGKATARLRAALDAQATEQQVTVTFDTNGGSQVDPQTIEKNSTVLRPDDPVKEGFVFTGWYIDKECTEEFDFDALITEDLTIYAGWDKQQLPEDPASDAAIKALQTMVDKAVALGSDDEALQAAIEAAQAVLNEETPTATEVVTALLNLSEAMQALNISESTDTLRADVQATIDFINENILNDTEGLRPAKVQALRDAVQAAQDAVDDPEADADQLKAANKAMTKAAQELWEIVTKAELEALIEAANGYLDGDYTAESLEALQTAITAAQAVANNDDATTAEVTDAITNLSNAIAGLESITLDTSALAHEIELVTEMVANIDNYVPSTVEGLADKLADAQAAMNATTQEEIDAAAAVLREARLNARTKADVSALEELIAYVNSLELSAYTSASAQPVIQDLARAKAMLANEEVTQEEVNDMADALQASVDNLVEVNNSTNAEESTNTAAAMQTGMFAGLLALAGGMLAVARRKKRN